jgi:hypothetical protein
MRFSSLPPALRCVVGALLTGLVITGLVFTPWRLVGNAASTVFQGVWNTLSGVAGFGGTHPLVAFWIFTVPGLVCACWLLSDTWFDNPGRDRLSGWGAGLFGILSVLSLIGFVGQKAEYHSSRDTTYNFGQNLARQESQQGKAPYEEFLRHADVLAERDAAKDVGRLISCPGGVPRTYDSQDYCDKEIEKAGWKPYFIHEGSAHTVGIYAPTSRNICIDLVQKEVDGLVVSVNGTTPAGKTRFSQAEAKAACTSYWDNDVRYFAQIHLDPARDDSVPPAKPAPH